MPEPVVPASAPLLAECMAFDHLAAAGGSPRSEVLGEAAAQGRIFTSTNRSNAGMQSLLHHEGWTECGCLDGLDEGDAEIFFRSRTSTT